MGNVNSKNGNTNDEIAEETVTIKKTEESKRDRIRMNASKKSFKKGSSWYSVVNIEPRGITVFFRQLAALIGAGMPLLKALRTMAGNREYGIAAIINSIADDIEQGETLSSALSKFPKIFSKIYLNQVVVAEQGGSLEDTLKGLANFTESQDRTRNQIKRALLYPAITLFIAIGVFVFVISYVIPTFISTILSSSENLGSITKGLFSVANFFNGYWWALLLGGIAIGFGIYFSAQSHRGKLFWDKFKLRVPIFGTILKKVSIMNITRSFGMLIQSGVNPVKSLRLLQETSENGVYAESLRRAHAAVEGGSKIYEPFAASKLFPSFVIDLITVGEASGQLDSMMIKIADAYQDEVEQITKNFGTLVEPILLLVIGAFTSLIVFSVFSTYIQTLKLLE